MNLLSQWLARHASDDDVRRFLAEEPLDDLPPDDLELVQELRQQLEGGPASRGDVEMLVRETLEALALAG